MENKEEINWDELFNDAFSEDNYAQLVKGVWTLNKEKTFDLLYQKIKNQDEEGAKTLLNQKQEAMEHLNQYVIFFVDADKRYRKSGKDVSEDGTFEQINYNTLTFTQNIGGMDIKKNVSITNVSQDTCTLEFDGVETHFFDKLTKL